MSISLKNIYIYIIDCKNNIPRDGRRGKGTRGGGFKEPDHGGLKGYRQKTLKHICGVPFTER